MSMSIFRKKSIGAMIDEALATDANGLRRSLSASNLVMLGIGAIVGTGIFVITGQAAAMYAGPALTISFIISAVGCVLAGLCYAEFAAMIPISGSVYSYSYATIGEGIAWFIGWDLILEYLFAVSSVAVGWSGYVVSLFSDVGLHLPDHLIHATLEHTQEGGWFFSGSIINFPAVFIVAIVSALLMGGIKQSAWVNNIIVAIKVAVILLFVGFGLSYIDFANYIPYIPENTGTFGEYGWSGILRGTGVVFFAYLGFDALSTAAQEAKNPQRDMPKGILISLLICVILYVAVTTVLTGIVNYKDLNVPAPLAMAIDSVKELNWLAPFVKLGIVAGITSVILVMMLGQTRIYYAISKDGMLPRIFSKVNKKTGAPQNATIFACIISGLVAGLFPLHVLAEMVSIGTLLAFTIVCVSVVVLRKKQPNLRRPFKVPFVPVIPLLGAAVCLLQMAFLPLATWLRLIIWMAVGMVIYFAYGYRHSKLNKR
ncbi:MAG: amino acid permease [Bacteroidales bacterium]|nr:amino acid permease [Bacteroidales bacterium]